MNNAISWFEIPSSNLERAQKFYETIFGISLVAMDMPNIKMRMFPIDDMVNGVGGAIVDSGGFHKPSATDGPLIYLNANPDVQQVLDKTEAAGGTILVPKTEISPDYGFMAVLLDTEGNRIALHSAPQKYFYMPGTKAFDWSRFVVRININASVEKIYRAWASRAGMESWFLRMSEYSRANGSLRAADELTEKNDQYRWRWFGWPDDMTESGSILEANGIDYFKFSFGSSGNCAISIHKEEGETIVELMQDEIPITDHGRHSWHLGCKTGWTFYFANLKSLLEGGIDLRNKNEQLKRMINS